MLIALLAFVAWMLVGSVVVETCRIWRVWWLDPLSFSQTLLWPLVLAFTVINGPDQ
jgi:hypothetical protein